MALRELAATAVVFVSVVTFGLSDCLADEVTRPDGSADAVETVCPERVRFDGFDPNDPYFLKDTPSSGWPGQWHLVNGYGTGIDANVAGAWSRGVTGAGVLIGIVDDCLEASHPDLAANFDAANSWDFGQSDADPSPVHASDMHGTSVAGVSAAKGGNGVGVTGAAPNAGLAGLRVDFENQTEQMFIDATLYHSSGADTSIKIKNHSYGYNKPYVDASGEVAALETSAAAGTIHVTAAGNSRSDSSDPSRSEDTNKLALQSSPAGITVAALGSDGKYASYSNYGACVFVAAPSSGVTDMRITTTDVTGSDGYNTDTSDDFPDDDYTSRFGGTSSASPLVAGVLALAKEVQPNLDGRMAKHLLAMTSRVVDAADASESSDGGWRTNAAGYHFNQNYGFGLVDADALTTAAQYVDVTPLTTETTGTVTVAAAIPDDDPTGVTRTFTLDEATPLEEVLVHLDVTHTYRGDVEAYLTSPSGYTSRLMSWAADSYDDIDWTFTTNAFWGEDPEGLWSLKLLDTYEDFTGTWDSFCVTAYMGELIPVPEPLTACVLLAGGAALLRRRRGRAGETR